MGDEGPQGQGDVSTEESLERLLTRLGPLMGRQERAEGEESDPPFAQPDPAFERALRDRLTGAGTAAPDPMDARIRPTIQGYRPGRRPVRRHRPRRGGRPLVRGGLAAAVLIAVALIAVLAVALGAIVVVATALVAVALAVVVAVRARRGP